MFFSLELLNPNVILEGEYGIKFLDPYSDLCIRFDEIRNKMKLKSISYYNMPYFIDLGKVGRECTKLAKLIQGTPVDDSTIKIIGDRMVIEIFDHFAKRVLNVVIATLTFKYSEDVVHNLI